MRILFINHSFPGLFASLAAALGADPGHDVFFASSSGRRERAIVGVRRIRLGANDARARTAGGELEGMVMAGRQALRPFAQLDRNGQSPDMVISSSSGGYSLFWDRAFPHAFRVSWTEATSAFPDPEQASEPVFTRNLVQCRQALSAHLAVTLTAGQPGILGKSLTHSVELPYAVDTERFVSDKVEPLVLDEQDVTALSEVLLLAVSRELAMGTKLEELLTGFLTSRPNCHVVLACDTMQTRTLARECRARLPKSLSLRLHVPGLLSLSQYRTLMRTALAFAYPPGVQVQATALLEAMSCGAALVLPHECQAFKILASGENVLFGDASSSQNYASALSALLEKRSVLRHIGYPVTGSRS